MYCQNCGKFLEEDCEICPHCGKHTGLEHTETKYCINCGQQIPKNSKVCPYCSKIFNNNSPHYDDEQNNQPSYTYQYNNNPPTKSTSNYFAIAGFICSFFFVILGWIFSGIGLSKSKSLNGEGRKLAIAGIIISSVNAVLIVVLYVILFLYIGNLPAETLPPNYL